MDSYQVKIVIAIVYRNRVVNHTKLVFSVIQYVDVIRVIDKLYHSYTTREGINGVKQPFPRCINCVLLWPQGFLHLK